MRLPAFLVLVALASMILPLAGDSAEARTKGKRARRGARQSRNGGHLHADFHP